MSYVEYDKGDLIDNGIVVTGHREGGFGRIYFGYCETRQIRVVVKTFRRLVWEEYELTDRWNQVREALLSASLPDRSIDVGEYLFFTFFREARLICQSRNHPNVIKGMRLWWTDSGQPFFECEFVEDSQDLGRFKEKVAHSTQKKRLAFLQVLHIAVSFCNGMIYISDEMLELYNKHHPNNPATAFVHRDIKPENILIDSRNMVKIIDMGLAKYHLLRTTSMFVNFPLMAGAFSYMPPEQSISYEAVGPSSDIYAFGATMYDLLGGDIANLQQMSAAGEIVRIEGMPERFHQILSTCLLNNMSKRYQSFRALRKELVALIQDVKANRVPLWENVRCVKCGYVSPDYAGEVGRGAASQVVGPKGHQMVRVPAGKFSKGCRPDHRQTLERKAGTSKVLEGETYTEVEIVAFDIDVNAVTNRQYYRFIKEASYRRIPFHWREDEDPPFRKGEEAFPVINVSYEDAEAYCMWAGLRLPTGDEWEKAARGTEGMLYPWGDKYDKEYCNSAESGNRGVVAADRYPEGRSPYGCCQMVGNVLEWVNESHPQSDTFKYLRGGCWAISCEVLGAPFIHYIASKTSSTGASSQKDIFGFRCARDAIELGSRRAAPTEIREKEKRCPLCGNAFVEFDPGEIRVPEKSIYTWVGFFDIE